MDIWRFFAGLGFFLYGTTLIEHALKSLSGRAFKLFLQKYTQSLPKAISGGFLLTAIVQSSSVVSLLVLAFVEAGTITFRNALGVLLGSNLGTTLTSWIVATVGFNFDIESFAFPIIGISAVAMFFLKDSKRIFNIFQLFLGLGTLFLGLAFMKSGGESLVSQIDFSQYNEFPLVAFLLLGFFITLLVQSSSATVAITLTAVYSNVLEFPAAACMVIGSELGTTIKIILAGLKGSADKRRVAWGNFIFNVVTCGVVFAFLPWFLLLIREMLAIKNPIIGLVVLQTVMNLLSIIIFLPFIDPFAHWLSKRFHRQRHDAISLLSAKLPVVPEVAVEELRSESEHVLKKTREFIRSLFKLDPKKHDGFLKGLRGSSDSSMTLYAKVKEREGHLLEYYSHIQGSGLSKGHFQLISRYMITVRYSIRGAKSMKDIYHDLKEFESSLNDTIHLQYEDLRRDWEEFDTNLERLLSQKTSQTVFEELTSLMKGAFRSQQLFSGQTMESLRKKNLNDIETSTLMNVQYEILSVKKSLLRGIAHLRLNNNQAEEFEFLPER